MHLTIAQAREQMFPVDPPSERWLRERAIQAGLAIRVGKSVMVARKDLNRLSDALKCSSSSLPEPVAPSKRSGMRAGRLMGDKLSEALALAQSGKP